MKKAGTLKTAPSGGKRSVQGRYGKGNLFVAAHPMATFKRILLYFKPFKWRVAFAAICLLLNVGATVGGTFMLSVVIDDYLAPIVDGVEGASIDGFAMMVGIMAALYVFAVIMSYCYNWFIVNMTTAIQRNIRDEMFVNMEKLPIKYFDTRPNGEIMSCYTNDADTLRELLANGVPYLLSNGLMVLGIFAVMLAMSPLLTLFVIAMIAIMFVIVKFIGGRSGKHFVGQQKAISVLDGYVEEHIEGMRVVKAFCHEDAEKAAFDEINSQPFFLYSSAVG